MAGTINRQYTLSHGAASVTNSVNQLITYGKNGTSLPAGRGYMPVNGTFTIGRDYLYGTQYETKSQKTEKLGETSETAATAYIYSKISDPKDNNGYSDNNPVQNAIWIDNHYNYNIQSGTYKLGEGLKKEADIYAEYRKAIENFKRANNDNVIKDTIVNKTVSTNIKDKEQTLRSL